MNKLTKRDINGVMIRSWLYQWYSFNYETMQSPGYTQAIAPVVMKLYKGNDDLIAEKLDKYLSTFYNTENTMHQIIMGAGLAIEESEAEGCSNTAIALRTALMGPFAGLGDSIFKVSSKVIFGAMAGYMALKGSLLGILLCIALLAVTTACRYYFFKMGYKEGASFITTKQNQIKTLTSSVVVLGLVVIGCMIPSTVKIALVPVIKYGAAKQPLQDTLNSIFPYLLPVTVTAVIYRVLGIKGMTTARMVWIIIAICVALTFFHIL